MADGAVEVRRSGGPGDADGRRHRRLRLFFFSSRRRHTRSLRDWSSDVCSSDLIKGIVYSDGDNCYHPIAIQHDCFEESEEGYRQMLEHLWGEFPHTARSEERRVGKECRWRMEQ